MQIALPHIRRRKKKKPVLHWLSMFVCLPSYKLHTDFLRYVENDLVINRFWIKPKCIQLALERSILTSNKIQTMHSTYTIYP